MDSDYDNFQFYSSMCSDFLLLIFQPTNRKSKILTDTFFSSFEFTAISGYVTNSISDHLIQFVILGGLQKTSSPCKVNTCKQNFKNFDNNKFKEDFNKIYWDKVIYENGNKINVTPKK